MSRTLYCQKQVVCAASFSSAFRMIWKKDSFGRTLVSVCSYVKNSFLAFFSHTTTFYLFFIYFYINREILCVFQLISVYLGSRYILELNYSFFMTGIYAKSHVNKKPLINILFWGIIIIFCIFHPYFHWMWPVFSTHLTFGGPSCGLLWAVIVSFFRQCE